MRKELKQFFSFIVMMLACTMIFAQQRTVSGVVVSRDDREPLQGATVSVKGSDRNTVTNSKGQFSITVSDESVLKISMVGYVYQEVSVGKQTTLSITMDKDNKQMEEVVVVGYGTQKRTHLTGSVSTLDLKKIEDLPVGNLSEALKGQMVGVGVSGGYSRPGEPATITIRNPVYFSKDGGSKEPLFVIDDIIRSKSDFDMLDASEVESISVLKDAAAAIYGIVGSNGVVIVKTKRGKPGQSTINYSASFGLSDAPYKPKMLSAYQQGLYFNAYTGGNKDWDSTGMANQSTYYTPDELDYFRTHNYNWLNEAWQQSFEMRHALNVTGGSDRATYFAGFTYNNQNSNFPGLGYNRYSFRASTDIKLVTGLKLGLSLGANLSDKKNTFSKIGGESLDNDWKTLVTQSQMFPTHINGLPVWIPGSGTSSNANTYNFFGIYESNNYTSSKGTGINFQGSLNYEFPFLKGLKANVNYNKNISNTWGKQYGTFYKTYSFATAGAKNHYLTENVINTYSFNNGDRIRLNPTYTNTYQFNSTLSYDKQIGKHQINLLAGYEQSEGFSDGVAGMVEGVLLGGLDNQNFALGANTSSETISESGALSYLGRLDYNYASKYMLQVQFRADAGLSFAPENRWGYFPSFSAGWVVSEEKFFNRIANTVNFLKLRGSVGLLGLNSTKPWQWARSYAVQTGKAAVYGSNSTNMGYAVVTDIELANRAVHWDNVDKYNVGLDARFLNNRLSASFDGFLDKRSNMLSNLTSSPSFLIGATMPSENFGKLNNFGVETSVSWRDHFNKNWSYGVTANFNWQDNKVLVTDFPIGDAGTFLDPTGKSQDMGFKGFKYMGMFRSQADIDAYVTKYGITKMLGYTPTQLRPGMLFYEDIRGPKDANGNYTGPDGVIDDNDQTYLNKHSENHYGLAANWSIAYKSLSLSFQTGLSWGGVTSVESAARKVGKDVWTNRPAFWADAWTPTNINAAYPNPYFSASYDVATDFWWRSSTQFRLNNFNLSYTLPKSITDKVRFNSARIYLVGTNVLNFKNPFDYKDNSNGSFDAFPQLRSFNLGLNVSL